MKKKKGSNICKIQRVQNLTCNIPQNWNLLYFKTEYFTLVFQSNFSFNLAKKKGLNICKIQKAQNLTCNKPQNWNLLYFKNKYFTLIDQSNFSFNLDKKKPKFLQIWKNSKVTK